MSAQASRQDGPSRRLAVDVPQERRGERLDQVLAALVPDQSRASVQRLIRSGRVTLGGAPARSAYRVRGGERVLVEIPPPEPSTLTAEDLPLAILHEDSDLLVLNKPPGMTVHPGAGVRQGTLVNALLHHCHDLSGIGGIERPGIVHRLDRDTSGVILVAKNDVAHRSLAAQFKARTIGKVYQALVWGRPHHTSGVVKASLGRHPKARLLMAVVPGGRSALSEWRLLEDFSGVSLFEIRPRTGRTHQIRVHLASIGHPIVGDRLYGGLRPRRGIAAETRTFLDAYEGLALHAREITFTHPGTGRPLTVQASFPDGLARLLESLRHARTA